MERIYSEVRCDYNSGDGFWCVDAWYPNKEEGTVIAVINDVTGGVYAIKDLDDYAKEIINEKVKEIKGDTASKKEKKQTLEEMVSAHAYDEIVAKVKEQVGSEVFGIIWPSIKKALEEGDGDLRSEILISWLDCDSMRVCTQCGKIMEEGWYLDWHGYACSDGCCKKAMKVSDEDFERYSIYKGDIELWLKDHEDSRKIDELSKEEIGEITDKIVDGLDAYYYTEWE